MGFSANGKQCLLPEEALYLMECGNLQVFHQDLPLSIQDGYEKFLSANTVSLQQYQVFGHLKRLGYVVLRFDPSSESSSYARQLNLPQSSDRAGRQLKRKRSLSPAPSSTPTMEEDKSSEGEEDKKLPEPPEAQSSADEGRSWWMMDVLGDSDKDSGHGSKSGSSCWDFSSISFPDLGSTSREHFPSDLAPPDPSLLPGDLKVGFCDIAPWRQKINLRQVKMSANEQKREKYRRRWDVNKNREVRRCRNWAEYQELMARRKGKREGRPAHLWNREVTPLHDPTQPIATGRGRCADAVSIVQDDLVLCPLRLKDADDWRICFNVYQPNTVADFKKSNPGKPYSRMCVCRSAITSPPDGVFIQDYCLIIQSCDEAAEFLKLDHQSSYFSV
uniref:TSEN54 tRNA splicing endonuclease subunit n=1 Tax=Haplochromis burtoni TaxID=8153 RepID=A0A3Q2X0W8_HAPBU